MCFPHSGHMLLSFHSFLPAVGVAWRTNRLNQPASARLVKQRSRLLINSVCTASRADFSGT
jgi:hypothetical protein